MSLTTPGREASNPAQDNAVFASSAGLVKTGEHGPALPFQGLAADHYSAPARTVVRAPVYLPVSLEHSDYKIAGDCTVGSPNRITFRGRLLHLKPTWMSQVLSQVHERLGRFNANEAKRTPISVEMPDGRGGVVKARGRTDDEGYVHLQVHGGAVLPGTYEATLCAPEEPSIFELIFGFGPRPMAPVAKVPVQVMEASGQGVAVWDLDETLVRTPFKSLEGLLEVMTRSSEDIETVPGMVALGRALDRRGPMLAVSGSPEAFRADLQRLSERLGVSFDGGIALKDYETHLSDLKEQVAYKLTAILQRLYDLPEGTRLTMVGDNTEADFIVYSELTQLLEGRISAQQLGARLHHHGASESAIATVVALADKLPAGRVEADTMLIRVSPEGKERAALLRDHPALVPIQDGLQGVLVLASRGILPNSEIPQAIEVMRREVGPTAVRQSIADLWELGFVSKEIKDIAMGCTP